MSNDPFAEQPGDPPPQWGQDPAPGPGVGPGAGLRAASVGKRVGALIVDGLGLAIIAVIVLAVVGIGTQGYLGRIIMSIIGIAYFALMEASSGQTVAKRLFGIKVVSADGSPVTLQAAVLRRLPFYVGNLLPGILGGLIGFGLGLAILITAIQNEPEHRGLHDNWAGTKVIDV